MTAGRSAKNWDWVLGLNPERITDRCLRQAYRLDQESCGTRTACKRNCQQKPMCIHALGQ